MNNENLVNEFLKSDIVFVSDLFLEEYGGGAERTTEALFNSSPIENIVKIRSNQVTQQLVENGAGKHWIFFNYANMNSQLIPIIVANLNYSIVEYDYKFCIYRSTDLHKLKTRTDCDCEKQNHGKFISAFIHGAEHVFWMSKKQSEIYHDKFSFIAGQEQTILSSIFDIEDLEYIEKLRDERSRQYIDDHSWAVIDGNSWIKGVKESKDAVLSQSSENTVEELSGLEYYDLLGKLSKFNGLSFHPLGADTCPRTTIEAKLLGLELSLNDNVQHKDEVWFDTDVIDEIESYLLSRHEVFWETIIRIIEKPQTISGYTTTKDVIDMGYPWKESIRSMLGFCDEVVVVDGGSKDGTWEELEAWARLEPKLKIVRQK